MIDQNDDWEPVARLGDGFFFFGGVVVELGFEFGLRHQLRAVWHELGAFRHELLLVSHELGTFPHELQKNTEKHLCKF